MTREPCWPTSRATAIFPKGCPQVQRGVPGWLRSAGGPAREFSMSVNACSQQLRISECIRETDDGPKRMAAMTTAAWRTLLTLVTGWGCRGRRLSRGAENPDRQRGLWGHRAAGRRREPGKAGPGPSGDLRYTRLSSSIRLETPVRLERAGGSADRRDRG